MTEIINTNTTILNASNIISQLSFDIFLSIIADDIFIHQGLLALPTYARMLTKEKITIIRARVDISITCENNKLIWRLHNKIHRVYGPAIMYSDGSEEWYYLDKYHRGKDESGLERAARVSGRNYFWYKYGIPHRKHGPAIISPKHEIWFYRGNMHRDDGPAFISADKIEWRIHGKLHRDKGPAIIFADGAKYWYQHGKLHREKGPAQVFIDGTKYWYQHGQLHNTDGPAIQNANGSIEYWINGRQFYNQTDNIYMNEFDNPYDHF